jgi:O-antigen/teichoic acid export membrane protein
MNSRKNPLLNRLTNPVLRGTVVYTAASVINAAIPFFLLPILTRYLTPEEYGFVSTFMACVSIFLLLVGLEQSGFVSVNFFSVSKSQLRVYLSNICLVSLLIVTVLLVAVSLWPDFFSRTIQLRSKWIFFSIVVAYFQSLSQLNLTLLQLESRPVTYGIFQISNSLVNYVVSIVLVVSFGMKEDGRILGIVSAGLLYGTASLFYLIHKDLLKPTLNPAIMRASVGFSLPLVAHSLAGWVNSGLDRILINNMVSVSENGLYSISYQIAMIVGMVASSFNRAFTPHIFEQLNTAGETFDVKVKLVRYTWIYYVLLTCFAAGMYVFSPLILSLLVDQSFYGAGEYLTWILIGFLADGFYYGVVNYLFHLRKTHYIAMITVSSCIVHFLISYFLLPMLGTIAAAYATAAGYIMSFVLTFLVTQKAYPLPWRAGLKSLFVKANGE